MTRTREHEEFLLHDGTVRTLDGDRTTAGAVLFRDGLVEAVADCRVEATVLGGEVVFEAG